LEERLAGLVSHSGLGQIVGQFLLQVMPLDPASPMRDFLSIAGITAGLNFVVTANCVPAIFTPLAQSLATASGLPLMTVLMIQVIGFSTPLLPYHASPIVVAIAMGKVPHGAALRLCLALGAITFLVLAPIDYGWFWLLAGLNQQ
jgi:di/tricarboxylate transporter